MQPLKLPPSWTMLILIPIVGALALMGFADRWWLTALAAIAVVYGFLLIGEQDERKRKGRD